MPTLRLVRAPPNKPNCMAALPELIRYRMRRGRSGREGHNRHICGDGLSGMAPDRRDGRPLLPAGTNMPRRAWRRPGREPPWRPDGGYAMDWNPQPLDAADVTIHRRGKGAPLVLLHCLGMDWQFWDV